jgi:phosphoribosylaminoimidazolecarboxamide formyltransferase/IMP cyclohydrolase
MKGKGTMAKVARALVSVSDKTGVEEFARGLAAMGVEIISTGGTARALEQAGIPAKQVSEITGFPEILGGRVKTLHPKIHGGILAVRDSVDQAKEVKKHGIPLIDLVAVNLYPFEETVSKAGVTVPEAIEQIDIGGVCLIRAAAKNWKDVIVITSPADYGPVLKGLREGNGSLSDEKRLELAARGFEHTAAYDVAISAYLKRQV